MKDSEPNNFMKRNRRRIAAFPSRMQFERPNHGRTFVPAVVAYQIRSVTAETLDGYAQ
jgi:hypothetical protein